MAVRMSSSESPSKGLTLDTDLEKISLKIPTVEHYQGQFMKFNDFLTEGGVACAMSHHKALQAIANHPTAQWGFFIGIQRESD